MADTQPAGDLRWRDLPWRGLLLILTGALVVQLAATANVKLLPDYDEAIYWDVSRNCLHMGKFWRSIDPGILFFDHPPLFLYFASPSFLLTDDIFGIRLVVSLLSLVAAAATALLAGRLLGKHAVLPAAAILAFNPSWIFYSNSAYQDVPFCVPILLAYLAAFRGRPILSGALTGAAFLVKYFALGFAGCLALFFFRRDRKSLPRFLAVFVLVASIWPIVGLSMDSHDFFGKLSYWREYLTMKTESSIKHHVVVGRGEYVQEMLDRVTTLPALLLLAGLIAQLARARKSSPELQTVTFTASAYLFTILGPFALRSERYLVEALPFLAILASGMLSGLSSVARGAAIGLVSVAGLLILMPGMTRLPMLARPQFAPPVLDYARSVREAGEAIARRLGPSDVLNVNWNGPRFGYFTRHSYCFLYTTETLDAALASIDRSAVVVRDHESGRWHLPHLAAPDIARIEERLARDFGSADFGKVRVFFRKKPASRP